MRSAMMADRIFISGGSKETGLRSAALLIDFLGLGSRTNSLTFHADGNCISPACRTCAN